MSALRLLHSPARSLVWVALAWLAGCATTRPDAPQPPPQAAAPAFAAQQAADSAAAWYAARGALASTGALRVGVYPGSPSSLVRDASSGKAAGVAHDLGTALAQELGVPVRVVEFERLALVLDALKAGQVDMTFTNATEMRAREVDFTPTLLQVDLGFLVPAGSRLASMADVDQVGARIGVSQGSSSQGALPQVLKAATLVPASSLAVAQQMLQAGQIQAFATNKGILFEMADALPGARVLDGRWGVERMAIAIPKGRESAMPFLARFAQQQRAGGQLQAIVTRAGMRGTSLP